MILCPKSSCGGEMRACTFVRGCAKGPAVSRYRKCTKCGRTAIYDERERRSQHLLKYPSSKRVRILNAARA
jgi:hypothetical protein